VLSGVPPPPALDVQPSGAIPPPPALNVGKTLRPVSSTVKGNSRLEVLSEIESFDPTKLKHVDKTKKEPPVKTGNTMADQLKEALHNRRSQIDPDDDDDSNNDW
jgi:hypothetical protein